MNRFQLAWYWPHEDDDQILRINDCKPCKAEVSSASTDSVDLIITDHFGISHVRLNVPLHPEASGRDWCSVV